MIRQVGGEQRILTAATAMFAEKGYSGTSMQQLARAANVSKATIFHHFPSKRALYLAVVREACRDSIELLANLEREGGSAAERLRYFAKGHLCNMLKHAPIARLILRGLLAGDDHHGKELAEEVFGEGFARLVAMIREGQATGELDDGVDAAVAAVQIVGTNVFVFEASNVLRHLPDVKFAGEPADFAEACVALLLHGLARREEG